MTKRLVALVVLVLLATSRTGAAAPPPDDRGVRQLLDRLETATRAGRQAGHDAGRWRLHGNVLMQMPRGIAGRDAVDVITTVGWARRLNRSVSLGVEGIGEDLEGFADPAETEGGARLLVGPSLHIAPAGRRWQLSVAGGPMFHPAGTRNASGALRDLPGATAATTYAVRTSFACSF